MIIVGAHLDILAMRLTELGSPTSSSTDTYNTLMDSIEVHKDILKFIQ